MKVSSKDQRLGFTVLELLIVVAIIGILAAVSVPLYDHYIAESRKPEASIFLKRIADGAVAYFNEEHVFEKNGTGFYVSWQEYPASKGAMADALGHMPYKSEFTQKRSPNDPNVIAKLNSPPWKDLKMRISSRTGVYARLLLCGPAHHYSPGLSVIKKESDASLI